jgi:hypothetical protein
MSNLSDRIRAALPTMSADDRATLASMRENAKKYGGSLTPRQLAFVEVILRRSQPAAPESTTTLDLTRITQMFDKAAQKLKNPKVEFMCASGDEFAITRAKDSSRNPGFLYLKSGSTYLGKIAPRGAFIPSQDATPDVTKALVDFAADPVAAAFAYGKATSACCFCRKKLTDGRSVEVGYGPICAENFGLPWGE